jgi:hypothetical protein
MPRQYSLKLLEQVREKRRGHEIDQGPDSLRYPLSDGKKHTIQGLRRYVDDPQDEMYYKLQARNEDKVMVHVLPIKEPKSYLHLILAGLNFAWEAGTVEVSQIKKKSWGQIRVRHQLHDSQYSLETSA